MIKMSALEIFNILRSSVLNKPGHIIFDLAGTSVTINTTDTVGNSIQSWLKCWLDKNNIYNDEPANTQEFPDFFLSDFNKEQHMLEVKAFNYNATPAFDIANYESYVDSVAEKPYRLDADYLIFGYTMDSSGTILIKDIWLKKIWEIAGTSQKYPLKTQVKREVIYNIRPDSSFKFGRKSVFDNDVQFLKAIYLTQKSYRGPNVADEWLRKLKTNYKNYYNKDLIF